MRLLQLHSDFVEYEPISKEISEAEETIPKARKRIDEVVVVFVAVESQDDETVAADAITEVKTFLQNVNCQRLLIYPYAHLSSDLARPIPALMVLRQLEGMAKESIKEVHRAPFGWTKSFNIQTKGHPLAESAKTIIKVGRASEHAFGSMKPSEMRQSKGDKLIPQPKTSELNDASSALRAEEKIQSYWYVIEPGDDNSTLIPVDKYKTSQNKKNENLKKLINYEIQKRRTVDEQPPHVKFMKKLAIADYEPASDLGNMRFYPKGKLIKFLIERFVTNKVMKYGGIEVETPIMYDSNHPSMQSYFNRFPARQYNITSDSKNLFLRFAACFGQFLMAKDFQISYKSLPLRLYELTRYSFRKEKSGELVGLRRLRAFSMPDCHAFCKDISQAKQELVRRFELSLDVISGIGLSPTEDLEMAIRFTEDFYQENKELIGELVSRYNKPVLVEMWKEKFFYFVLKWEFNFIDDLGKASALSTDQIDVENAIRYHIDFVDEDGTKKYPIILHNSPSGAIERVIYALLEKAARVSRAGAKPSLPLWLTHTQVRVIPVGKQHLEYCVKLAEELSTNEIRADIDDRDESISKRIRESESEWIHYTLVVGDKETETQILVVRNRTKGIQAQMSLSELIAEISSNTGDKPHAPLNLPQKLSKRPLIMV
ncbi:MAG TPA: threonine--tRNA ligase [Nitrososphaeraceae archaeon]|nr:threonine--tRNA ligase [Nitrososphaeraceae archaeon]